MEDGPDSPEDSSQDSQLSRWRAGFLFLFHVPADGWLLQPKQGTVHGTQRYSVKKLLLLGELRLFYSVLVGMISSISS
jgi:hypothetical protein